MKQRIEYALVRMLIAIVRVVPDGLVRALGTLLGLAFYTLDGPHRRIAQRNLAAAFPGRPEKDRRLIARAAFAHFGRLLFELLKFSTLSPQAMLARVEFEGEDRARMAYAQGRGVLFVTGHFGFWSTRCASSRSACSRARSTIPISTICSSACGRAPATP
jgi:KDO2-lipid IV(A) lauroyltransferase